MTKGIETNGESASARARRLLKGGATETPPLPESVSPLPLIDSLDDDDILASGSDDILTSGADEEAYDGPSLRSYFDPPGLREASDIKFGDILLLDSGAVFLYRQPVPEKGCDFTYELCAEGALEARGVDVRQLGPRLLGRLDSDVFNKMIHAREWDRDAIVFYLEDWTMGCYVPPVDMLAVEAVASLGVTPAEPMPVASAVPTVSNMPRGTRFSVQMGENVWDAVFWGRDNRGSVVAHDTEGSWYLIHLDLERFGDSLKIGDPMEPEQVDEIAGQVQVLPH